MSAMTTFSWIGIMLLVGVVLRAVIKPLGNILMPASVIGGIAGFILVNLPGFTNLTGIDPNMCSTIVNLFFTLSFISMGLTATPKGDGQSAGAAAKQMVKGSFGMGLIWAALYCIQPLVGFGAAVLVAGLFSMPAEYGMLIPFAFCQGPGQSASFGAIIDATTPFTSATQVAITFSVIGFLFAFLVGVPIAKYGLKKGFAAHPEKLSPAVMKGIYKPEEQTESAGKITTYNGNIDTLAFHLGLVCLTYALTIILQQLILKIPVSFLATMGSMTFIVGFLVASIIKVVMSKLNVKQYHDDALQARITGCTTDFLIVGAFMAVQMSVIGNWMIPILFICVATGLVTLAVAMYFGPRLGGDCDFERTLGLWGCLTGTCPSGVALIRVVDPNLKTTASAEMGMMNAFMLTGAIVATAIIEFMGGRMMLMPMVGTFLAATVACFVAIKIGRCWNKPTFHWRGSKVVCPDVTDDCDKFENTGTRSQF